MKKILLFIVIFLSVLAAISYVRTHVSTTSTRESEGPSCDVSLCEHVYHGRFATAQDRLAVLNPCVTISGTIVNARQEADGDWHVQVALDPEFSSLLNQVNLERQQGYLVLEPMCSNRITQADVLQERVCDNFNQTFSPDLIGYRIAATGAYVLDREHGWTELHPVTSIVRIE